MPLPHDEIKKSSEDEVSYHHIVTAVGIYLIFEEVVSILENSLEFAVSKMPLKVFFQAIASGFEQKMSKIVLKEKADPGQTATGFPLRDLHHKIAGSILDTKHHRNRISETFKKSFQTHLESMNKPVDKTIAALIEGTKQIPSLYEMDRIELINKMLFMPQLDLSKLYRTSVAAISASAATLLVSIDSIGRFIGKQLAIISKYTLSNAIAEKTIIGVKAALVAAYISIDLTKRLKKYSFKSIIKGIYFPIFSGIFIGMYGSLSKDKPELTDKLKGMFAEATYARDKSIFLLVKESIAKARKKHQTLETALLDKQSSSDELITHDFYASKQLIEALRVVTSLLKKSSFAKTCFIAFKAFPKIVKKSTSLLAFNLSKTSTSALYTLIKSINKKFKETNKQQTHDHDERSSTEHQNLLSQESVKA